MKLSRLNLRTDQFVSICSIALVLILYRSFDSQTPAPETTLFMPKEISIYSTAIGSVPILLESQAAPNVTASAAAVIDLNSKAVLFEKSSEQKLLPASTTKLMTALIAREIYNLDQVLTVETPPEVDGAAIDFYPNESLTVQNLLSAMLIQSGNDAAMILAAKHPEGTEGFIADMNDRAAKLNLTNTHFANVTGFDHHQHYSTAEDLALLTQEVMKDEVIRAIVREPQAMITDLTGVYSHYLYSTNYLLSRFPEVVGVKTGTTQGAGEVLITQVERNDIPLLIVVMGSQSRYDDTIALMNWAYEAHQWLPFNAILESEQLINTAHGTN